MTDKEQAALRAALAAVRSLLSRFQPRSYRYSSYGFPVTDLADRSVDQRAKGEAMSEGKVGIHIGVVRPGKAGSTIVSVERRFRATAAERVDGIDYGAFTVKVFVGSVNQFPGAPMLGVPAEALFRPWSKHWTDAVPGIGVGGIDITVQAENKSDRLLPFDVTLVGKLF